MIFPIFVVATLVQGIAIVLGARSVKRFLTKHQSISSQLALNDFKTLARNNMKGALILMPFCLLGIVFSFRLVSIYGPAAFLAIIAIHGPMFAYNKNMIKAEKRSRTLDCEPPFREEYSRVGHAWVKKPWPDF